MMRNSYPECRKASSPVSATLFDGVSKWFTDLIDLTELLKRLSQSLRDVGMLTAIGKPCLLYLV